MDTTRSEQSFEDKRVTKLQLGNEGPLPAPKVLNKVSPGQAEWNEHRPGSDF